LSADPNIQAPLHSQSHNRYSYVINNPLKYTDPSGFIFGIGKRLKKWAEIVHKHASNSLKYSGDPGYHVAHSKQVENFFRKHRWAQRLGHAVASYYGGPYGAAGFAAYLAEINGGSAFDIYKAFALSYLSSVIAIPSGLGGNGFAGYAIRTTMAAVVGGTMARLGGGKFANGAVTGAFVRLFGDAATMQEGAHSQEQGNSCVVASTRNMILEETGVDISEADLRQEFRDVMGQPSHDFNKQGINPVYATKVLEAHGVSVSVHTNVDLKTLQAMTVDRSVMVGFRNPGHRVILQSVSGGSYSVLDPASMYHGNVRVMTEADFSSRYNQRAIVISPNR
jgi:hypothetical protein